MKINDQEEQSIEQEDTFIECLAHQLGMSANARFIYGEPVGSNGVTVIPVAKTSYASGGGGGTNDGEKGSGGGGGVSIIPVGYIEIKNGETCFRHSRDWLSMIPVLSITAPIILLSAWAFSRLFSRKN